MKDGKDRGLLTLKLVGSKLDTENMRASEALNIAMSLFRNIERADKNITLNNIKSGCIECTGNIAVEYINTPSTLKDILLDFLQRNAKVEYVDMIETATNKKIYTVRPENKEELFFNVVDFFEGEVIDIGGRDPNIHIIIDGKVRVFSIPEKDREIAKKWRNFLYEQVEIYAEVLQNINGEILETVRLLDLNPINYLDKNKAEKDFNLLVKEIDISNYTQKILDIRNIDE
ncbi:hypothetical protein [uncultured Brachyspira sp.]|uniref:hypothetical protein n=1 Tax=uncultured Brachyspira sp. TaxID=221953 RepID=UPI00261C604F|nr:hypothetical protein [uncultured Brachyspira sp.]